MSIIPAARLSASDLARLGNNFKTPRRQHRSERRVIAAVNRSLATVGERINRLHKPSAIVS